MARALSRRLRRRTIPVTVALAAAVVAAPLPAQEAGAPPQARARLLEVAREVMDAARYCALITIDEDGQPRARTMDPFPPDDDMVVWMATRPSTRKVGELRENGAVTLYYFDAASSAYVSIAGHAEVVDSPEEKARWWKPEWEAFYANRDEAYTLIRVVPHSLEVVSVAHGIEGDETTWLPPVVRFPRAP